VNHASADWRRLTNIASSINISINAILPELEEEYSRLKSIAFIDFSSPPLLHRVAE
jgi:hypothetical protein